MSTVDTYPRHYSYPLVTWGSTLLGGVLAVVTSVMLMQGGRKTVYARK